MIDKLTSLDILTLTIYGEARGETIEGQIAVACVIRNRVNRATAFNTFKKVCLRPWQFSCWNANDPNRKILEEIAANWPKDNKILKQCEYVAKGIYNDLILDNTGKADHYMTSKLYNSPQRPKWAKDMRLTTTIGNHIFLRSK